MAPGFLYQLCVVLNRLFNPLRFNADISPGGAFCNNGRQVGGVLMWKLLTKYNFVAKLIV